MRHLASARRLACAGLVLALAAAPARAGILDSITGMFSGITGKIKGMFGGKSTATGGALDTELAAVEGTQKALHDVETKLIEKYNSDKAAVTAGNAEIQGMLNDLADKSRANEDAYLALLKKRSDLLDQKADVSAYKDRLATAQENQRRLEEGYQKVQDFNKGTGGFFDPPPTAQADGSASPIPADFLNDPRAQRAIDEWLASQGLDPFGRRLGGNIKANYNPDTDGRTRYRYVWENLWNKTGLGDYVMAKLRGENPSLPPPPPATQEPAPTVLADAGTQPGATDPGGTGSTSTVEDTGSSPAASADAVGLNAVRAELTKQIRELQSLQASGQGLSPRAKELLSTIEKLQAQEKGMFGSQAAGS